MNRFVSRHTLIIDEQMCYYTGTLIIDEQIWF